jgi:hypothetical protein
VLNDITAQAIGGEEYCFDFFCSNIHIDGFGWRWDTIAPNSRIHLSNALILNHGFQEGENFHSGIGLAPDSRLTNVTMLLPRYVTTFVYVPDGVTMENVTLDIPLVSQGKDVRLNNLHAPEGVVFHNHTEQSSGVMLSPITPYPLKVDDETPAGRWYRPLFVQSDGKAHMPQWSTAGGATPPGLILPSPADGIVPLTVKAAEEQTADLQQWKDHSGNLLFAILKDGHIGSTHIDPNAPPGSANKRLKIHDETGAEIGYIPIHPLT